MNTIFHIVTSFGTFQRGGMEISTGEIVENLLSPGGNKAFIYCRASAPEHDPPQPEARFVDIFTPSRLAAAPLLSRPIPETGRIRRVEMLCLRGAIEAAMRDAPDSRHVILSFYISSNGFPAQQVADLLRLPHVACVRGSDFNVDALSVAKGAAVRHVSDRCDYLVLTNQAQCTYFKEVFGRSGAARVIYNQVAKPDHRWAPSDDLEFFSDCGFSWRKATQVLLRAFDIFRRGWPEARLCVVGPRDGDEAYWAETLRPYESDPRVELLVETLTAADVEERLLRASAYVSASLGEGCSRAVLGAAIRGVPIVSTAVGILPEPGLPFQNLFLAAPASAEDLAEAMGRFALARQSGELTAKSGLLTALEELFSPRAAREAWHEVVSDVVRRNARRLD